MAESAEIAVLVSLWSSHARQTLHSLLGHFHGRKRVFLTQVDCGLFHGVELLHLTPLKLRKGPVGYYEVTKMEWKGGFTVQVSEMVGLKGPAP